MHVDWDLEAAEKGGYEDFMLKEIHEQPDAVRDTMRGRLDERDRVVLDEVKLGHRDRSGPSTRSSWSHAAPRSTQGWPPSTRSSTGRASRWSSISRPSSATATRYSTSTALVIGIAQSGETADTLAAIRFAQGDGGQASLRSRTSSAPRSLVTPTPSCSPMRDPRSGSLRRRRSWRSSSR